MNKSWGTFLTLFICLLILIAWLRITTPYRDKFTIYDGKYITIRADELAVEISPKENSSWEAKLIGKDKLFLRGRVLMTNAEKTNGKTNQSNTTAKSASQPNHD